MVTVLATGCKIICYEQETNKIYLQNRQLKEVENRYFIYFLYTFTMWHFYILVKDRESIQKALDC